MTHIEMPAPIFANGTFSAEQMKAYADARVRETLEEAVQVASDWSMQYVEVDTAPRQVGEYIRALIPKEE